MLGAGEAPWVGKRSKACGDPVGQDGRGDGGEGGIPVAGYEDV